MIPLKAKLWLALEEISEDVLDVLLDHSSPADPMATTRRTIGVSDVVVTPQMKRWHAVHTLEVFYRDAFNNQLNSRYQAKFNEYHELSQDAREKTYQFGIGLALTPIPRAQMPVFSVRRGADSGDDLLRAGELGVGERAGRRPERCRPRTTRRRGACRW